MKQKQYIDKSALVAEVERRIKVNKELMLGLRNIDCYQGKVDTLNGVLSYLDTLEVKEVQEEPVSSDIEAEFVLYLKRRFNIPQEGNTLKTDEWSPSPYDLLDIAKYFAKWQKEQTIDKVCEWLRTNYEDIGIRYIRGHKVEDEIESFKKSMEE